MGGNGSGGGKRSGGGGGSAGITERFVDSYTRGTSVKFKESDSKIGLQYPIQKSESLQL